jgi:hypothetical protein
LAVPGENRLDLLLSEIDRQLGEQRAHADALASRSGLMIAATALLTGLLAPSLQSSNGNAKAALWMVGVAACAGILIFLMGRLVQGPSPSKIVGWLQGDYERPLLDAKILAVEANKNALTRTEVMFAIQACTTVGGIVFLLLAILGNP